MVYSHEAVIIIYSVMVSLISSLFLTPSRFCFYLYPFVGLFVIEIMQKLLNGSTKHGERMVH